MWGLLKPGPILETPQTGICLIGKSGKKLLYLRKMKANLILTLSDSCHSSKGNLGFDRDALSQAATSHRAAAHAAGPRHKLSLALNAPTDRSLLLYMGQELASVFLLL